MPTVSMKLFGRSRGRESTTSSSEETTSAAAAATSAAGGVRYFYGRISRDEAETALSNAGLGEGLYLLRESVAVAGNYVLSICHNGQLA